MNQVTITEFPKWVNGILCRTAEDEYEATTEDRAAAEAIEGERLDKETKERKAVEATEQKRVDAEDKLISDLAASKANEAKLKKQLEKANKNVNSSDDS